MGRKPRSGHIKQGKYQVKLGSPIELDELDVVAPVAPFVKHRQNGKRIKSERRWLNQILKDIQLRASKAGRGQGVGGDIVGGDKLDHPRYLVGRFPSQVAKGDTATLNVLISRNLVLGRSSPINNLDVPKDGLLLDIEVQADGFEFLTPQCAPIYLPQAGDSTGAAFDLKAVAEDSTTIHISAFNRGTPIGGLDIPVKLTKPVTAYKHNYACMPLCHQHIYALMLLC
jgi:hypothetical protein